ncbi:MAG: 30S ribosomal protein S27ae [Candidatus Woesearchaeota archaeon]
MPAPIKKEAPKAADKKSSGEKKAAKGDHTRYKSYLVSGGKLERKNRSCPKCGPGIFMAKHKDREACGKCGYTEMGARK